MDEIALNTPELLIFAYAIISGILVGYYLVLLNKLQKYWLLKRTKNKWFKIKEGGFRVILSIASIYFVFIMPMDLLRYLGVEPNHTKKLYDLYFYCVVFCSLVSIFVLIKLRKIQIKKKP